MKYIFVLGRHAVLSVSEIKAVLVEGGSMSTREGRFMLIDTDSSLPGDFLSRLGGTDRIVEVLGEQDHQFSAEEIALALPHPGETEKKITLGISGLPANQAKSLGNALKKILRGQNKSVRFIIPKGKAPLLNAAQVLFNRLLTSQNVELVFAEISRRFYVGRTVQIQDIQAYEVRDTARPARYAKIGMLPPKLAQIMLNLAMAALPSPPPYTIYDPFCGTGVALQEGWLMGHMMLGSDSNPKMVVASQTNLEYVLGKSSSLPRLFKHDVRQPFPENLWGKIDAIVTEPYLGRSLSALPSSAQVAAIQKELRSLYRSFFGNARVILKSGGVILVLLPAFRQAGGTWAYFAEAFLDEVAALGYVRKRLVPKREEAVYARPDAVVGRELTLWQKR